MAARQAARLAGDRWTQGTTVDLRDTLIAGISQGCRTTLSKRNQRQFQNLGIPVINPFHG